jgi:uncharacterized damage-inducible protein DinB
MKDLKEFLLKWYRYSVWANDRVLSAMQQQGVTHDKILTLMSHVLSAQFIWLHRIKGLEPPPYELWRKYELTQLMAMAEEAGMMWLSFISENISFDRELVYKNYQGLPYTNNVEQIMIHLVNHGTYHRGQVALLMRENGYEPVNTDFITYDRVISGQLKV